MIGGTSSTVVLLWMLGASWTMAAAVMAGGAAAQQLELGEEVRVMEAPSWGALVEPHLAAHPEDPEWLVGGVIVQDTTGARTEVLLWHAAVDGRRPELGDGPVSRGSVCGPLAGGRIER